MEVTDKFLYDEGSPSCLKWKVDIFCGQWMHIKKVSTGDFAGSLGKRGYYIVRTGGKTLTAHRIIWELMTGEKLNSKMQIDHIDGDRTNNKFENLRVVTNAENNRNKKKLSKNKSGKTGVFLSTRINKNGSENHYWVAGVRDINSKHIRKQFSVLQHSWEGAFKMACDYRDYLIEMLNREFNAGYTSSHGEDNE